jgi:AcrR family transcriptional regulator
MAARWPADAPPATTTSARRSSRGGELFARRGYTATSMNEVAEACGLSKATLYHYYRDKDALLVHIAEGHVSRLQALVAEVARAAAAAAERPARADPPLRRGLRPRAA